MAGIMEQPPAQGMQGMGGMPPEQGMMSAEEQMPLGNGTNQAAPDTGSPDETEIRQDIRDGLEQLSEDELIQILQNMEQFIQGIVEQFLQQAGVSPDQIQSLDPQTQEALSGMIELLSTIIPEELITMAQMKLNMTYEELVQQGIIPPDQGMPQGAPQGEQMGGQPQQGGGPLLGGGAQPPNADISITGEMGG